MPKLCGHPFKLVAPAISATPVADRCIQPSTQPWNIHRRALVIEWTALKSSVTFNVAPPYDATFPTSQFFKFLLELHRSTVSAVIV